MRDRKVADRYARALLEVAIERDVVDGVAESFDGLMGVVVGRDDLRHFMQSPQVPTHEKKALITDVLSGRIEETLLFFLELLLDKDRILNLADIHEAFIAQVEAHKGLRHAQVVTAIPLPADLEQKLRLQLEALTGQTIILDKKVDPAVIGGVCVTLGDQILDGTLRTGLSLLRESLERTPLR
jgi:F-type H+-transporting ATPase subunit delta